MFFYIVVHGPVQILQVQPMCAEKVCMKSMEKKQNLFVDRWAIVCIPEDSLSTMV